MTKKKKEIQSLYKSELGKDKGYRPTRSPEAAPFWAACKEGRLSLPQCTDCRQLHFYPRPICPHCGGRTMTWRDSAGTGKVYSYAIVRQAIEKSFADLVPYVIAIVELDEGIRLLSHIRTEQPETITCGMEVKVDFEAHTPELTIPVFRPATTSS